MEGCSVTLNTDVQTQRDHLMLWRFGDEGLLIAKVDKEDNKSFIYDDGLDGIFKDRLQLNDQTGDVIITNTRIVDTGLYQLKITSNKNKTSYKTFSVYVKGTHFSVVVVVTYFVLLLLCVLVLLAIAVYQSHHESSGLRQIKASCKSTGNKRGIRAVVFHCVLKMLLVMLVLMLSVVTYSYIMTLDLEKIDDKSSTTLAVVLGVLQMMLFLAANIVFQRISQQKQRGICLGVLHLLLLMLLMLIVAIYTIGFVDLKQLEGHMSKIYIILLVLMVLGVIHYFSESFYLKLIKVQKMPVFEGESVFLPTGVSELQSDDVIQLSFENQVIVKFNKANRISSDDERFRDRLLVDDQTGSLIIRNMRADDTGLYKVKMSSNSQVKSFLEFITGEGPTYSQFNVIGIRENESLMVVKSLLNEAEDDV